MKEILKKAESYIMNNDLWIFVSLLFIVSIIELDLQTKYSWALYYQHIGVYIAYLFPILVFVAFRGRLSKSLNNKQYYSLWTGCFIIYLSALCFINNQLIVISMFVFSLEVLLVLIKAYPKQETSNFWLRKIRLEPAIILTLFLIAVVISLFAISSYQDPRFHTDILLIGFMFDFNKIIRHFPLFLSFVLQFFLLYMVGYFFYFVNHYFLVSRLLKQRGLIIYFLGAVSLVAVSYPIIAQLIIWLPLNTIFGNIFPLNPYDFENAWGALAVVLLTLPIILAIQWFKQNNQIVTLEKQRAQTELDLLKHQINPHFFFNTLNNLYSLSLAKSSQTPEVILQLSELMRYVIYQGSKEKVLLTDDINYLEDYIQLQQIRLRDKADIKLCKDIKDNTVKVAPMLFIILVENAFKHGIEPAESNSFCHFNIESDSKTVHFTCINSYEPNINNETGIGLTHLRKRLDLLYLANYELNLEKQPTTFKAELKIRI